MVSARPFSGNTFSPVVLKTYSTTFSLTENPISEGGAWHASGLGLDRTDIGQAALPASSTPVVTASGIAHGVSAATSASGFDDGRALLSGFRADHACTATISSSGANGTFSEVEIHLRFDDSGTYARGYELFWSAFGQYLTVVRWNGDGSYNYLYQFGSTSAPVSGDVFYGEIKGNLLTCKINGVRMFTLDITAANGAALPFTLGNANMAGDGSSLVFSNGNPGIGFDTDGNDAAFGFTDLFVTELA